MYKINRFLLPLLTVLLSLSCSRVSRLPYSMSSDRIIDHLKEIALDAETDIDTRYVAMDGLINHARGKDESRWLLNMLAKYLENNPEDPYGAYYLTAMAQVTRENGSTAVSIDYMRQAIKNYPDLIINGKSLHLLTLESIASLSPDTREAIAARERIRKEYAASIDKGLNHYLLASKYREIGKWDKMYESYQAFLKYPKTVIPNFPDARNHVYQELNFHKSNKSWIRPELETLVKSVQLAISTRNARLLNRYKSNNFFHMSWNQETSDSFTHIPMTIGTFLSGRVRYKSTVESASNDSEAYLWTTGWSWKIPTWYFYFQRINYPVDPEIHGQWEWKGIYFGERF